MHDPEKTSALVVGIDRYAFGDHATLRGPVHDAWRMASWLVQQRVPPARITVCVSRRASDVGHDRVDGVCVRDATSSAILAELFDNLTTVQAELLVVYWSGHGVSTRLHGRRLFFSDASANHPANIDVAALLEALKSDRFPRLRKQVIFVDACANFLGFEEGALPTGQVAYGKPVPTQQFVLYSAGRGDKAVNLPDECTGLFTRELMATLRQHPGWPPDLQAVARDLGHRFQELRRLGDAQQTPAFESTDWSGSVTRLGGGSGSAQISLDPLREEADKLFEEAFKRRERTALERVRIRTERLGEELEQMREAHREAISRVEYSSLRGRIDDLQQFVERAMQHPPAARRIPLLQWAFAILGFIMLMILIISYVLPDFFDGVFDGTPVDGGSTSDDVETTAYEVDASVVRGRFTGSQCLRHLNSARLVFCNYMDAASCEAYRRRLGGGAGHECLARPGVVYCRPGRTLPSGRRDVNCFETQTQCTEGLPAGTACAEVHLPSAVAAQTGSLTSEEIRSQVSQLSSGAYCLVHTSDRAIVTCHHANERACDAQRMGLAGGQHHECVPRFDEVSCAPSGMALRVGRSISCYAEASACESAAPRPAECTTVRIASRPGP